MSANDKAAMDNGDMSAKDKAAMEKAAMDKAARDAAARGDAMKPSTNSVYFAFDSAHLSSAGNNILEAYATWLNANNDVSVTIEGNCDQRGSREYNLALGQQRADSVKAYLVARGVSARHIDTVSFGEERPACRGTGEACWAQNRHADIVRR